MLFRRRIVIQAQNDQEVRAALEDDFHHFRVSIRHNSEILTDKAKKKLIDTLNLVLAELHKPTTNWNTYFKNVGYSIMLLGSLGSIAGGAVGVKQLNDSKKKLEEANQEVQQSLNFN